MRFSIFQYKYDGRDIENFILTDFTQQLFPNENAAARPMLDGNFYHGDWETPNGETPQGNPAHWIQYRVLGEFGGTTFEYYFRTFYTVIDNFLYIFAYSVSQISAPDNFSLYLKYRINPILETVCFPINNEATKPCPDISNPSPHPTEPDTIVTEEWINTNYKQNPNFGLIYNITLSCNNPINGISCKDQPTKIREVHVFAGSTCITNPSTCDSGTKIMTLLFLNLVTRPFRPCSFRLRLFLRIY